MEIISIILMVSNKIVHEHGGSIRIESTVNEGTFVEVILPIYSSFLKWD